MTTATEQQMILDRIPPYALTALSAMKLREELSHYLGDVPEKFMTRLRHVLANLTQCRVANTENGYEIGIPWSHGYRMYVATDDIPELKFPDRGSEIPVKISDDESSIEKNSVSFVVYHPYRKAVDEISGMTVYDVVKRFTGIFRKNREQIGYGLLTFSVPCPDDGGDPYCVYIPIFDITLKEGGIPDQLLSAVVGTAIPIPMKDRPAEQTTYERYLIRRLIPDEVRYMVALDIVKALNLPDDRSLMRAIYQGLGGVTPIAPEYQNWKWRYLKVKEHIEYHIKMQEWGGPFEIIFPETVIRIPGDITEAKRSAKVWDIFDCEREE